jgi:hypothetical protein
MCLFYPSLFCIGFVRQPFHGSRPHAVPVWRPPPRPRPLPPPRLPVRRSQAAHLLLGHPSPAARECPFRRPARRHQLRSCANCVNVSPSVSSLAFPTCTARCFIQNIFRTFRPYVLMSSQGMGPPPPNAGGPPAPAAPAAAAAPAPPANGTMYKDDPRYKKYFVMIKVGVGIPQVCVAAFNSFLHINLVHCVFSSKLPETRRLSLRPFLFMIHINSCVRSTRVIIHRFTVVSFEHCLSRACVCAGQEQDGD